MPYRYTLPLVFILLAGTAWPQQNTASPGTAPAPQDTEEKYEGPTVLSRDRSIIGERGGKLLDYRFFGAVTGVYDSGLTPVITDQTGNLLQESPSYGVEAGFGLMGSRAWRRDRLSAEYRGTVRHYPNNSYFDGIDQFLNISYGHVLSRRWQLSLRETAGITSLANGEFSYLPISNTDVFALPSNELFDNRMIFLQTRADATYQKTARLSFSFGGDGFLTRRRSTALAGLTGANAHGDIAYRLTRRQTVSVNYSFTKFNYQRQYGDADVHAMELGYSVGIGRRFDFGVQAGAMRMETLGLTIINLDPAIAAIVGRSTAVSTFHAIVYAPTFEARLIRRFERSSVSLNGASTFNPGNGVYLASKEKMAGGSYSYAGLHRTTIGANAAWVELQTIGQGLPNYKGENAGVGSTYRLNNAMHLEFRYDFRHYSTGSQIFRKNSHRVSLGLAFSPGERPLAIW